jgi:uncharacterized protein (DUF1501 family)
MGAIQHFIHGDGDRKQALVVVFLRGGADGLNMVAPLEDDGYYRSRPRIAITKPNCVALDGFYGLNPLLADLKTAYSDGALGIVHAAGSEDDTRSHFEAQDLMEHGGVVGGGWLGRFLRARNAGTSGPLSAVALSRKVPESLRGSPATTVFSSLDDFTLGANHERLMASLARLYQAQPGDLGAVGNSTLEAVRRIEALRKASYKPAYGASYGDDEFSRGLLQIARLIKSRVGLEAASIDLNGWDSHFGQSAVMDPLMTRLAKGLGAFYRDMGSELDSTTLVVMTEFGRRVAENSAFGTDHGRGSIMFVMGGGIKGGQVFGKWPGLTQDVLEGPGDLPVVTNYRSVLAPILQRHGSGDTLDKVFPSFELQPLHLYG